MDKNKDRRAGSKKNIWTTFLTILVICSMLLGTISVSAAENVTDENLQGAVGYSTDDSGQAVLSDESTDSGLDDSALVSPTPEVQESGESTDESISESQPEGTESTVPDADLSVIAAGDDSQESGTESEEPAVETTDSSSTESTTESKEETLIELDGESEVALIDNSAAEAVPSGTPTPSPSLTPSLTPTPTPTEEVVGAAATIKEGLYIFEIRPDGATKRAMAIKGNSSKNYVNVIMGSYAESNVRLFYVEKSVGTYYKIRNLTTGKYLQVSGNKTANGTLVKQNASNTSTAQQWQFVRSGGGYMIIGRKSGKALNVQGDVSTTGTCLEIRTAANKASQIWYPRSRKKMINSSGITVTWPGVQRYTGKEKTPGITLSLYGETLTQGTDYTLEYSNNINTGTATVTAVGINDYTGRRSGSFTILNYKTSVESGGIYYLVPKTNTSLAVTVTGSSIKNNVQLSLAKRSTSKLRRFTLLKTSDGKYKMLTTNPLYTLTGTSAGVLKLYSQQNKTTQRWTLLRDSQGAFSFVNRSTGQAIAVDGKAALNSKMITTKRTGADTEKFYLLKSTAAFPTAPAYIEQYNNSYIENTELTVYLTPASTNSKISLYKQDTASTAASSCSGGFIDFKNRKIGMYRGFIFGDMKSVLTQTAIPFQLEAGHRYKATMLKDADGTQHFTLTDPTSGESVSVEGIYANTGRAWGKFAYVVDSGSVTVNSSKVRSVANPSAALAIVGDSYIEGASLRSSRPKRYAALISEYLNGDVYVSCKGGSNSTVGLQWFDQYLFETVKPKYILIAFGMNDTNYSTWVSNMQKMIALAEANGVTPILATIPQTENELLLDYNGMHQKMSAWVRKSGYRYIDIAKVLSLNNDGKTVNSKLILNDQIHPSVTGHRLIYEEFLAKCGDLF